MTPRTPQPQGRARIAPSRAPSRWRTQAARVGRQPADRGRRTESSDHALPVVAVLAEEAEGPREPLLQRYPRLPAKVVSRRRGIGKLVPDIDRPPVIGERHEPV